MIFRSQFTAKGFAIACLLLVSSTPVLADHHIYHKNVARQNPPPCVPDSLLGRVGPSNGGRKVGLVIDASGSMAQNDPNDLRLAASKALNDALISQSEAISGKTADLVTVVDFSSSAELLYPLGDPSGANSVIDSITPGGGTAIGTGVKAIIDELTKPGNDPTANRTGIIVFTDGQDDPPSGRTLTISETKRAASLGIRVSFGFLSVDSQNQDVEILRAILQSGGIYATVDQASAQQTFITLALANGLTGIDATSANGSSTLLPGLATAKFLSQTGSNTFTYAAKAGETFNVTVTAIDPVALNVALRDVKANTDIKSNTTDSNGVAFLEYTAQSNMDIEVVVTSSNSSATGIFSVGLKSSIPFGNNCSIPTNTSTPISPTASLPAQYTGGAVLAFEGSPHFFAALLSGLGLAVAAAVL
jgi:Mg-chelatase subunit ChlD